MALRRSGFLNAVESIVDVDSDINAECNFFSYEHFYVIYCKFWELDCAHSMSISIPELMRYGDSKINPKGTFDAGYKVVMHAKCAYRCIRSYLPNLANANAIVC